ncbi:MAG: hypothetical protein EAZ95_06285 [Bacteroidetes bacterium]|nr:MAG: hypothetical protein EAZ95_06285 [Bacteroidota bacterium]
MARYFADIHVHATMRPFHQNPSARIWDDVVKPENCNNIPFPAKVAGIRRKLATFAQSNLNKAIADSGALTVRTIFNVLYPVELNMYDIRNLLECIMDDEKEINLGRCLSGFPKETIEGNISKVKTNQEVNYLEKLQAEYTYLVNEQKRIYNEVYSLEIAQDYAHFQEIINSSNQKIAIINTIEGLHCFIQLEKYSDFLKKEYIRDVEKENSVFFQQQLQNYTEGINIVKNWGKGRHSPLFITFTHHFWNFMCGQAQSFEGVMETLVIKQQEGLSKGFTLLGKKVLEMLLSNTNGRRILIDTKHMSAKTRQEYYAILKTRYPDNSVPVIASHTAVSGIKMLNNYNIMNTGEPSRVGHYFNPWSINICDEDIRMIYQTKGLIGLLFLPERLEGNVAAGKRLALEIDEKQKQVKELVRNFLAQAFHIVRVCNHKDAWDLISIGSDFDGLVGYLKGIDTFEHYPKLENMLLDLLENLQADHYTGATLHYPAFTVKKYKELMFGMSSREILDKIMYQNVERFLKRYFHDDYLLRGVPNDEPLMII